MEDNSYVDRHLSILDEQLEYEYEPTVREEYEYEYEKEYERKEEYEYEKEYEYENEYEYEYEYDGEQRTTETPTCDKELRRLLRSFPETLPGSTPLQGACEHACLKLNLVHDGGFSTPCTIETAIDEFPYCLGSPTTDDKFHARLCIETCRQSDTSGECPRAHSRLDDMRGCEAGRAFKKGNSYVFTMDDETEIIFRSLVNATMSNNDNTVLSIIGGCLLGIVIVSFTVYYCIRCYHAKAEEEQIEDEESIVELERALIELF